MAETSEEQDLLKHCQKVNGVYKSDMFWFYFSEFSNRSKHSAYAQIRSVDLRLCATDSPTD